MIVVKTYFKDFIESVWLVQKVGKTESAYSVIPGNKHYASQNNV